MDRLNFFVNEIDLATAASRVKENAKPLETILDAIESLISCREFTSIYCVDDFYSLQVDGTDAGQLIFENANDGDFRDLIVRLQIIIETSVKILIEEKSADGQTAIQSQNSGGWISVNSPCESNWWNYETMFWVSSKNHCALALRHLFVSHCFSHLQLDRFAEYLFPNIYFHESPSKIMNTSLDYHTVLSRYIKHLSYLNDHAYNDFAAETLPHVLIATAGSKGVEMSPESPKTRGNRIAMRKRDISVGNIAVCCEWHTKLENIRGRIHFYPWQHKNEDVKKITGNRVIVGIITEHLP